MLHTFSIGSLLDSLLHEFMVVNVKRRPRINQGQARAHLFRFTDSGAGLDAECLGFIRCCDHEGRVRHERHDSDRLVPKFGAILLFNRRKIGIQIQEEDLKWSVVVQVKR